MVIVFYWFNQTAFKAIFSFHSANFSEKKKKIRTNFHVKLVKIDGKKCRGKETFINPLIMSLKWWSYVKNAQYHLSQYTLIKLAVADDTR